MNVCLIYSPETLSLFTLMPLNVPLFSIWIFMGCIIFVSISSKIYIIITYLNSKFMRFVSLLYYYIGHFTEGGVFKDNIKRYSSFHQFSSLIIYSKASRLRYLAFYISVSILSKCFLLSLCLE